MQVDFKFRYGEYVTIKVFGLNCEGRIVRCIHDSDENIYDVQYAMESTLNRAEFYEDELEAK